MERERLSVNGTEYEIERLLGKGKGGYSWLASSDGRKVVLKQIHHEPCSYYQFGDKIQSEINDYRRLSAIGIRMPAMLDVDTAKEIIVKEYIEGETADELVIRDGMKPEYLEQVREMCALLYPSHTNIDYFPTNFVVRNGELFYIDYECNDYMEEWNFENWGIKYWSKTPEFLQHFEKTEKRSENDGRMIKTERLSIRRVISDDWKSIQRIWADEAESGYARYDKPNDLDDQAVMQRIRMWASFADSDEHIFYAACLQETIIGYLALHQTEDGYELGYCFHSDYHGKGYAKESISAVLANLKKNGEARITAGTALQNTPSVSLLLSLGFRQIETEKVSFYKDTEGNDIVFDGGIFELIL